MRRTIQTSDTFLVQIITGTQIHTRFPSLRGGLRKSATIQLRISIDHPVHIREEMVRAFYKEEEKEFAVCLEKEANSCHLCTRRTSGQSQKGSTKIYRGLFVGTQRQGRKSENGSCCTRCAMTLKCHFQPCKVNNVIEKLFIHLKLHKTFLRETLFPHRTMTLSAWVSGCQKPKRSIQL